MPLLGGLFHRRNNTARTLNSESVASSASNRDSDDGDYVLPDKSLPHIYNLPSSASSSKLKLPFRRRSPLTRTEHRDTPVVSLNDVPRISSVMSDSGHDLPPPPHKSSLFRAYNDSHRSLPNESSSHVHSDTPARLSCSDVRPSPAGHSHKKSSGFFSWARERTKSKPLPPSSSTSSVPTTSPSADDASSSFNLKSFRHVRTDSPATSPEKSPPPSSDLLPPARPRPRGDSVASDNSQRISVAAFREAHARSRANSPVSSFRPPSTADTLRVDANGKQRTSSVSVVSGTDRPQSNKNVLTTASRPDTSTDTSSESESSEDDEEVDSDGEPIPKPAQRRTIAPRCDGIRSRSDTGHGSVTTSIGQASHARQNPSKPPTAPPTSDRAPFTRTRASLSTSALAPSGAARRASILAAANSSPGSSHAHSRHPPHKVKGGSDDTDTDSEDMPLSDLVPPRRPGSSASNQSNGRPWMPAKPLIDINSLAGGQPLLKPILRHQDSVKRDGKGQEQDVEKDQPFSIPAMLSLSSSTSPLISPSVSKQNPLPLNKPPPAMNHRRSSGDTPATAKPEGPDDDEDLMNAIRLVGALDKEQDQPSATVKSSNRIVPTPIREREPPTSFTVLSRPPQRQSTAETSLSLSPISQTHSVMITPAILSQPESGARQRTATTTKSPVENDNSDALSVTSAARSSRSASRIPPVPLIHSIPDSPSVKEGYKPGRPRSASRTSAVTSPEGRSQPLSTPSNKIHSHGFQPPPMPQRPFASNRPTREESPAGSSTGDSSSGRAPFTPRDGSDIGVRSKDDANDMDSTLKARGHAKKPSVTFEDFQPVRSRERAKTDLTSEERTRERRRSEAKAAHELGKIVNGRGPLVHDGDDDDMGSRGRNPTISVTLENTVHGVMPGWAPWQQPMGTGLAPMAPPQFNGDPTYLAAHQRALMIAKQAYQMAVAQHAMQVAGEEWERSSNAGFGSGGSAYGGGSVYGGTGGSVYGGGSGGSVYGGAGMPMGMMGVPNMGMLMPPNQWSGSSVAFPGTAPSVYGGPISSSQSDYGGSGGGNWATRSAYGDSFGSSTSRTSFMGNGGPSSSSASAHGGNARPRARTGVSPPSALSRAPGKNPPPRTRMAAPPSSWKSSR